jgi:hypothetical protein
MEDRLVTRRNRIRSTLHILDAVQLPTSRVAVYLPAHLVKIVLEAETAANGAVGGGRVEVLSLERAGDLLLYFTLFFLQLRKLHVYPTLHPFVEDGLTRSRDVLGLE